MSWPPPRAGLAAAAADGQDGKAGAALLPPPTYDPSTNQWPDKGWKGGKNKGKDKGKGEFKGGKKGKEKGQRPCFIKMNRRLREP